MLNSRRTFLRQAGLSFPATLLGTRSAWLYAQGDAVAPVPPILAQSRALAATTPIKTMPLRGGLSVLFGSGGNVAVLPGKDGKVLVDSGYVTAKPQMVEALSAISADSLTHLINTHWHFDHTDGNEWMHAAGATILASKACRDRMAKPETIAAFQTTFAASPTGALPVKTFDQPHTVKLNGATLQLTPYAPAHTDTDISIYFQEADVLHVGDTWFNGFYPFIDYSTGGSIDGMIAAADKNLTMSRPDTLIIPGHGKVGDKAQLADFRAMLVATRAAVAAQKKKGKTLAETIAAKPLAAYDSTWGTGFMKPEAYIGLVYQGV